MSKFVAITAAVLVSAAVSSPAFAKKHSHHHMAAPAESQVMLPAPLIGGPAIRVGSNCYVVRNADWGAGYTQACAK
jgi:hypothetical protein